MDAGVVVDPISRVPFEAWEGGVDELVSRGESSSGFRVVRIQVHDQLPRLLCIDSADEVKLFDPSPNPLERRNAFDIDGQARLARLGQKLFCVRFDDLLRILTTVLRDKTRDQWLRPRVSGAFHPTLCST